MGVIKGTRPSAIQGMAEYSIEIPANYSWYREIYRVLSIRKEGIPVRIPFWHVDACHPKNHLMQC